MISNHAKILKNLKKNGICCFCCAAYKKLKNKPNLNVVTRKKNYTLKKFQIFPTKKRNNFFVLWFSFQSCHRIEEKNTLNIKKKFEKKFAKKKSFSQQILSQWCLFSLCKLLSLTNHYYIFAKSSKTYEEQLFWVSKS